MLAAEPSGELKFSDSQPCQTSA